jgi:hypothetical protein
LHGDLHYALGPLSLDMRPATTFATTNVVTDHVESGDCLDFPRLYGCCQVNEFFCKQFWCVFGLRRRPEMPRQLSRGCL